MRFRLQMYKIFVNCHRLKQTLNRFNMRKAFFLLATVLFFGCTSNGIDNNCFPFISMNETVNLDLPQFIDLQVTGGYKITNLGNRDVVLIRRTSNFQCFDLQCPEQNCNIRMNFDGLKLICTCNQHEYNSLNGSPLTEGLSCFAKEYRAENLNGSILKITNF